MLNIFKGNKIHLLGLKKKWVPGREFNHLEKILQNLGFEISTSKIAFKTNSFSMSSKKFNTYRVKCA